MEQHDLRLWVVERWDRAATEFWLIEIHMPRQYNLHLDEEGRIVQTEIPEAQALDSNALKPFLVLPRFMANIFMKQVSDKYLDQGIKTVNENLLEGKMQAMELHLTDMREITKHLLKIQSK